MSSWLASLLVLAACGGTGDDVPTSTTTTSSGSGAGGQSQGGGAGAGGESTGCDVPEPTEPGEVATHEGLVRGVEAGETWAYLGVPFAAPPTGDLRWKPPAPATCRPEALLADSFPAKCPQKAQSQTGAGSYDEDSDEDCLYLNVWRPKDEAEPRAVMVFIHGGAFTAGSSSQEQGPVRIYDGRRLSEMQDVVVVTLQYRVGALGFLAHPALSAETDYGGSGNYGLMDQTAGLRWVRDNIAQFGGDPDRVTVFGESAGAVSVCLQVASPLATGLFSRAAMQSGACVATPLDDREQTGLDLAADLGCEGTDVAACLRGKTARELVEQDDSGVSSGLFVFDHGPTVDGYFLPEAPLDIIEKGQHNAVPFIIGSNADETQLAIVLDGVTTTPTAYEAFVRAALSQAHAEQALQLYPPGNTNAQAQEAMIRLTTDGQFICNARRAARAAVNHGPVWRYSFDHIPSATGALLGAFHGAELFFVFGNGEDGASFSAADVEVRDLMMQAWGNLARTGAPDDGSTLTWPAYAAVSDPYLQITAPPSSETGLRTSYCDFWDQVAASP